MISLDTVSVSIVSPSTKLVNFCLSYSSKACVAYVLAFVNMKLVEWRMEFHEFLILLVTETAS